MSKPSDTQAAAAKGKARQPEKKIGPFANGVGVSIWLNTAETADGPRTFRSIVINPRRYFDKESNEWKDAASFNPSDLPALLFCLNKAQEYCYENALPGSAQASPHPENSGGEATEIPF